MYTPYDIKDIEIDLPLLLGGSVAKNKSVVVIQFWGYNFVLKWITPETDCVIAAYNTQTKVFQLNEMLLCTAHINKIDKIFKAYGYNRGLVVK